MCATHGRILRPHVVILSHRPHESHSIEIADFESTYALNPNQPHPRRVLHNIMAIFTFMGTNVMRQDDNYSFHVIQQSIETVIPPLVNSAPANAEAVSEMALGVIKVGKRSVCAFRPVFSVAEIISRFLSF